MTPWPLFTTETSKVSGINGKSMRLRYTLPTFRAFCGQGVLQHSIQEQFRHKKCLLDI